MKIKKLEYRIIIIVLIYNVLNSLLVNYLFSIDFFNPINYYTNEIINGTLVGNLIGLSGSLFIIFKIIGLQKGSLLGGFLGRFFGPMFRSKKIIEKNLKICFKKIDALEIEKISFGMWSNIGRTFAEYVFL